jgi:hypothetical protein
MPFIAFNYATSPKAPVGTWVCSRTSSLGPFATVPPDAKQHGPYFCGQCVSYVTQACPTLPAGTFVWKKGAAVKDNPGIAAGTVIATFNEQGHYFGHAAIYVRQDAHRLFVYDQWVSGTNPKAIGPRQIAWHGHGIANRGDGFFVVEI